MLHRVALDNETLAAVRRYGPTINDYAERTYGLSGTALLAKLVQGESSGSGSAVSKAGAVGWTQFMPGSRKIAMDKYGVDPWADPDQAVHGAVLHLQGKINGSKGLAGYNPGDPSYTNYILGQKVGNVLGRHSASSLPSSGSTPSAGGAEQLVSSAPTSPQIQGGQAGDYTSVLNGILGQQKPQAPTSTPIAPPAFSAQLAQPQGFTPLQPSQPQQQEAPSATLGLLESLQGSAPTVTGPTASTTADGVSASEARPVVENVELARTGYGADAALEWAKSKIGFKEATGNNDGGLAAYANKRFGMSNQAWCAMFTSLAVTKGGAPKTARTASVAEVRRQASNGGGGYAQGFVDPRAAKSGDLILFGDDHIAMVDHVTGGKVFYVGGNQSNGVTMASTNVGNGDIVRPLYGTKKR